ANGSLRTHPSPPAHPFRKERGTDGVRKKRRGPGARAQERTGQHHQPAQPEMKMKTNFRFQPLQMHSRAECIRAEAGYATGACLLRSDTNCPGERLNKNGSPIGAAVFPTKERPQSALQRPEAPGTHPFYVCWGGKTVYCTFTFSVILYNLPLLS